MGIRTRVMMSLYLLVSRQELEKIKPDVAIIGAI